jgi:hypothetical protein
MRFTVLLLAGLIAAPASAAESSASDVVRGFFSALDREDFAGALGRTVGDARMRTAQMVHRITSEAARKHVGFDVITRKIDVSDRGLGKVSAQFEIDIVARFLMFKRVVRKIAGVASFDVDLPSSRITVIDGTLDR